jgi:hypothetical protein
MDQGNENMTSMRDLVGQLAAGSMSDAETTFKQLMDRKVGDSIRSQEKTVARQMFGQSE